MSGPGIPADERSMATLARERQTVMCEIEAAKRAGNAEDVRRLTEQFTAMGTLFYLISTRCALERPTPDAEEVAG